MAEHYEVHQGDCASSIAFEHGFFWETLWNHPSNSGLKQKRKDPNILKEGDIVSIPELTLKEESGATGKRHRFKLKGVPAKLKLRILRPAKAKPGTAPGTTKVTTNNGKDNLFEDPQPEKPVPDEPRANVPYILAIEGNITKGSTDGDGVIVCKIPPDARSGELTVEPDTPNELKLTLELGHLNPASEPSGLKHRLANLGLGCEDLTDESTPEFAAALRAFQEKHGLAVTGEPDAATRDKLVQVHGG